VTLVMLEVGVMLEVSVAECQWWEGEGCYLLVLNLNQKISPLSRAKFPCFQSLPLLLCCAVLSF